MQDPSPIWGTPIDREELARFILARKDRVLAIVRRRLFASVRSTYDSDDAVSSVIRRLDRLASRGALRFRNEAELWSLIGTIVRHNSISRARLVARANALLQEDHVFARMLLDRFEHCSDDGETDMLILELASAIKDERIRQGFLLRVRGATLEVIAGVVGMSGPAFRQRWVAVMNELSERFNAHHRKAEP